MPGRSQANARRGQSGSGPSDSEDNVTFTSEDRDMLHAISNQLHKLDILSDIKTDVSELKRSVEYTNVLIEEVKKEQKSLKEDVVKLQSATATLASENVKLKMTLLDLQCRSMRNNLLIMGIEEKEKETYETSEIIARVFMQERLGIPEDEVRGIQLERVHRLGQRKEQGKARPLVVKFTNCKTKDQVLGLSRKLKGTNLYMSNQYPAEVVDKRRKLIPIMKALRQKGQKVRLVMDKLYVNGELHRGNGH